MLRHPRHSVQSPSIPPPPTKALALCGAGTTSCHGIVHAHADTRYLRAWHLVSCFQRSCWPHLLVDYCHLAWHQVSHFHPEHPLPGSRAPDYGCRQLHPSCCLLCCPLVLMVLRLIEVLLALAVVHHSLSADPWWAHQAGFRCET